MADLNRAQLFGRLGADPEIRTTQNGEKVANFRIATGEKWKDRNTGEDRERTEWHSIVVWGKMADVVERFLRKGKRVMVEGNIRTRKWQDASGNDRYTTEIVLSGFDARLTLIDFDDSGAARSREDSYGDLPGNDGRSGYGGGGGSAPAGGGFDDEIPF